MSRAVTPAVKWDEDGQGQIVRQELVICVNCGNDEAAWGHNLCLECLEEGGNCAE